MQTLLSNTRWEDAIPHGSRGAGTADINGTATDMTGYEGVLTRVEFGTIAATAVTAVKGQESDASATGWADIEDAEISVPADHDNKYVTLDVPNIRKRYFRVQVDRGTGNAAITSAQYCKYNASFAPTAQPSDDLTAIVTPA